MLVKLLDKTLTEIKIDGKAYPIRWEIDDSGNAVLGIARVDGLGFNKDKGLYQTEVQNNVDVFYKQISVPANSISYVYLDEIQHGSTALVDISKYKSVDIIVSSSGSHDFEFAPTAGFRTISEEFGAYFSMNLADISDVFVKTSKEHDTKTNNDGTNKKYIYAINLKVVQSLFGIAISNKSATNQTYNIELRAYKG